LQDSQYNSVAKHVYLSVASVSTLLEIVDFRFCLQISLVPHGKP